MPSTTALAKRPQLAFVSPRLEVYKAVSYQIHTIFADYTDLIEPLSLDEAYLDVTANRKGLSTASDTATRSGSPTRPVAALSGRNDPKPDMRGA